MRVGDFVKTYAEAEARFDGTDIVVTLGAGHIGRVLDIPEPEWVNGRQKPMSPFNVLVEFSGNRYWLKNHTLTAVGILDEMGRL